MSLALDTLRKHFVHSDGIYNYLTPIGTKFHRTAEKYAGKLNLEKTGTIILRVLICQKKNVIFCDPAVNTSMMLYA